MKKFAIAMSVVAMSMGFVACDSYELPNPPAQSNPQVAPFDTDNINVTAVTPAEGETLAALDLKAYNDENKMVPVGNLKLEDWPENYDLNLTMHMSLNEDMSAAQTIPAAVDGDKVVVAPDELQAAIQSITKDPAEKTVWVEYSATAGIDGNVNYYIGGPDFRFGKYSIAVKPFPVAYVIEDEYYLVSGDNKLKMNHSDVSPYDDPVFSLVTEIPADQAAAGFEWSIVSASGKTFGGTADETGTLTEGDAKGVTNLAGSVMFEINMETLAYSVFSAYEFIYTPGNSNGWNQAASNALTTTDYVTYSGWAYLNGEWKFDATLDWKKPFGNSGEEGKLSTDPGAGNLPCETPGVYYLTMNISQLTYSMTLMESCGLIGDATPAGWDGQTNLTQDAENPMIWTGKVNFAGAGEWKIRFNDNWDFNLGGDMLNLSQGGANIPTPGEGEKTVTVNLSTIPYVVTVE